jgi:hypothetical protein
MRVATQQDGKIVKPSNDPLQLHAVHQENGHRDFVLPDVVEEYILNALVLFSGHFRTLFLFLNSDRLILFLALARLIAAAALRPFHHSGGNAAPHKRGTQTALPNTACVK